jgi:low affinity Fe/Cu permease
MDRFFTSLATRISGWMGQPLAFIIALLSIILWGATGPIFGFSDTWQLIVNTTTTIITFLMVALLQNSQTRNDQATQHKLNAVADGLADLMAHMAAQVPDSSLDKDMRELRAAVGLEAKESTSGNTNEPTPPRGASA